MTAVVTSPTNQKLLEEAAFSVIADGLVKLSEYINSTDPDPEIVLKVVNSKVADMGKTVPVKEVNPLAGLQMVHITIGAGVRIAAQPAPLEIVEEVAQGSELAELASCAHGPVAALPDPVLDAALLAHDELLSLLP